MLLNIIAPYGALVAVKDCIEILFFSSLIYIFQSWLKKDTEHNLLRFFYIYALLFFGAHYADLAIIRTFLFLSAPVGLLLFMMFHQETLQKNFVKLAKMAPIYEDHWIDELIRCCLMAINKHKDLIIVIERNDHLKSLIQAPYYIYAELKKDLFDILLDKHQQDTMIWINQQGKIVAINSDWRHKVDPTWLTKEARHIQPWKQQGLFFTSKTDALVFKINPLTRNFDLIIQGGLMESISAQHVGQYLKKHLMMVAKKVATEKRV